MEEKEINKSYGGRIAHWIKKLQNRRITCHCGKEFPITTFKGYNHPAGIRDASGEKWWLYTECPSCQYQYTVDFADKKAD